MDTIRKKDRTGEQVLRKMYQRCVLYSFSGAFTVMLNSAVDGLIISRFLGKQAMVTFGLIVPVYSLINLIPVLLRTASQLNLGTDLGRGDPESARRYVFQMLISGAAASLPFLLLFTVFRASTVSLLTSFAAHTEATAGLAGEYLLWFSPSMLPLMLCPVLHPVMGLDGDMKRSPRAIFAATIVNITGDLANALFFHGGMAGMAATTTLSCYTELLVLLLHYRSEKAVLRPLVSMDAMRNRTGALAKGLPAMLRELCAFLTGFAMNILAFRTGGEDMVAALAAANSVWLFLLPAAMAVSESVMTLGSISWGEADLRDVRTILKQGLCYAVIPCGIYAIIFLLLAHPLTVFCAGANARLMNIIFSLLLCFAPVLPAAAICQVIVGYLNVTERKNLSAFISCLDGGVVWLLAAFLLSRKTAIGIGTGRLLGEFALALLLLAGLRLDLKENESHRRNRLRELLPGCPGVEEPRHGRKKENPYPVEGNPCPVDRNPCPDDRKKNNGKEAAVLETTVYTAAEAAAFSESLHCFFLEHNLNTRICFLAALCTEELACNTLQWGYSSGKETVSGVDIRAVCRGKEIILRFRDAGMCFNPGDYISQFLISSHDPGKNVGLRIIAGIADEMQYMCVGDCNILLLRVR